MKAFIGTKRLKAKPMNRLEYNKYRGWELPKDENGADEGMLLEEPSGYITWSPLDVFNRTYTSIKGMTFGEAIQAMKEGQKVYRVGWNGKGMFLFLVPGSTFKVNRPPLLGIYPEGTEITYQPHIDMKTADGRIVPWFASQSDLLDTDWEIIND